MIALERRKRLTEAMQAQNLDVLLVYGNAWQNDYLRYVTDYGILEGEGVAIIRRDGDVTIWLDSINEADRAAVEAPGIEVVYSAQMMKDVEDVLHRSRNARMGAAPYRMLPRRLAARKDDLKFSDETDFVDRFLMVKMKSELEAVRRAARYADEGYEVFRNAVRVGRYDYELIAEIENFFRSKGVDDNFMIIGVGGPEVRGMAPPQGKIIKKGDLVITELTPCLDGYYSQICRTLVVGEPSTDQTNVFDIYNEALEAGIATVRAGVTAHDVAKAENEVFRRNGLGVYVTSEYTRVRGHGMGLFVDTKPHILEDVDTVLEAGMTLIVHPNTYNPTVGYFVHGDSLAVTETGADVFCKTPRALFSVPA